MTTISGAFHDPGLSRFRTAGVTWLTAALSGATASIAAIVFGVGINIVVLAVMLSISFTAARAGRTHSQRMVAAITLPVVAVAAGGVGMLTAHTSWIGDALYIVVLSGAIWLRRFGPLAARIGTLVSLPFVTMLVVPVPVPIGVGFSWWAAVIAVVVLIWATLLQAVARRTGVLPTPKRAAREPAASSDARAAAARTSRMPASTRMAAQMAVALTAGFAIGHLVFGEHWAWTVITAYIVSSGNHGRGDVLHKGMHRTVGALLGTGFAALLPLLALSTFRAGASDVEGVAIVVAIAVVLGFGLWMRTAGYGWWAASMTAMLSLLHELTGTPAAPVMVIRLAAVLMGGVIASGAAWFVLPVRTGDVLRKRTAETLAALQGLLTACLHEQTAIPAHRTAFDDTVAKLDLLAPTLQAQRAARIRSRAAPHRADVIRAIDALAAPARAVADRAAAARTLDDRSRAHLAEAAHRLGAARRMLRSAPSDDPVPGPLSDHESADVFAALTAAVADLPTSISTLRATRH